MKSCLNVAVVGAGVAGLSVASLLVNGRHRRRVRVTVLDRFPIPQFSRADTVGLRVSAVANGSAQLLDSVGAWRHIEGARTCAFERMRVWDHSEPIDGPATLHFDAANFAVPQLGFIVEDVLLRDSLALALKTTDVDLRCGTGIDDIQIGDGGCRLRLADGSELSVDLVIAADGANSPVRELAGITTTDYPYDQTAFVSHVMPQLSHEHTAWQRFLSDGPIGVLPLSDGRVSIVWSTTDANAMQARNATDVELTEMLTRASDGVLGRLSASGPRATFPLCARHANRYVQQHVALIGDAAHTIHPLAGQGGNLGMQDALALAETVEEALDNEEYAGDRSVLRRFERRQKGLNATMLHFMTGLNRLFTMDSALARDLRKLGMRLFNHSGPIRSKAVKVALGMSTRR